MIKLCFFLDKFADNEIGLILELQIISECIDIPQNSCKKVMEKYLSNNLILVNLNANFNLYLYLTIKIYSHVNTTYAHKCIPLPVCYM